MKEETIYNSKEIFEEKILPLVKELKLKCCSLKIPMFFTAAIANDSEKTTYYNDMVYAGAERVLNSSSIPALLLSINGLDTKFPDYIQKNIIELKQYQEMIENEKNKEKQSLDIELTEDRIPLFTEIVSGNMQPKIPTELTGRELTEEEILMISGKRTR